MSHAIQATAEAVPDQAEPEARLMTHAYDGIREYDNPLPGWWRMFFIGTVVFSVFYALYFHVVGWGSSVDQAYRRELAGYDANRELRERAALANVSEASLQRAVDDPAMVSRGAEVFTARCASCHGPDGAGLIGPNLTDGRQIHGASRLDIYRTVAGGAPGTAMLAWSEQLPQRDVLAATAFAITLRGKNLRGKPPEGLPVGPFAP